jgi:hypothetical protein
LVNRRYVCKRHTRLSIINCYAYVYLCKFLLWSFFFMCVQFTDFKFYDKISNYLKHASAGICCALIWGHFAISCPYLWMLRASHCLINEYAFYIHIFCSPIFSFWDITCAYSLSIFVLSLIIYSCQIYMSSWGNNFVLIPVLF